jgi:hypothetical protein
MPLSLINMGTDSAGGDPPMRICPGHTAILMLWLMLIGGCFAPRALAATCIGLPPSTLRIYDIKTPQPEEWRVPAETLDRLAPDDALQSRHALMLTTSDVVTLFEIRHRMVPQADGAVCDAPSLVRIGVGTGRRVAYLARAAAADSCVRAAMLAHAEDHYRSFNATVDHFIGQQKDSLERGMIALKQMPGANAALAKARWEAGLRTLLSEVRQRLLDELRAANAAIDAAATLAEACGGKMRQLQAQGGF